MTAARMMAEWLSGDVAVVSLEATDAAPPLIYQLMVTHLTAGIRAGDSWSTWVQPDTYEAHVPARAAPCVSKAPRWSELAEWVATAIENRVVVVYDGYAATVLLTHLPHHVFRRIVYATDIVRTAWPDVQQAYTATDPQLRPIFLPARPAAPAQDAALTQLVPTLLVFAGVISAPTEPLRSLLPRDNEITESTEID